MGIKFYCPQCQGKLNVKSFLAGKKAICPKCKASIDIPAKSTRGKEADGEVEPENESLPASDGDLPPLMGRAGGFPEIRATPRPGMKSPFGAEAAAAPLGPQPFQASPQPFAGMPAAPVAAPVAAAVAVAPDRLAERPLAVWYVRHPSGGQYGPAQAEIFRRWIAEGRVSIDSLVWRDDWADWQRADQVFPQLAARAAAVQPAEPMFGTGPSVDTPEALAGVAPAGTSYYYRKKSKSGQTIVLIILLALVLILVPLLVMVLMNQAEPTPVAPKHTRVESSVGRDLG